MLLSPHLLVDHLSTASVQCAAEKKKGRLTLTQASMGRGEHSYLAGNPPPSSFVKGTHLKGAARIMGRCALLYFKKTCTEANPHPACRLELIGQYL